MKKVLMVACVPSMIGQFNMSNIEILVGLGYKVGIACNFNDRAVWGKEKVDRFSQRLKEDGISCYQTDFTRNALEIPKHIKAYGQMMELVQKEGYEMIHCHTPIAAAIARMVAHQTGTKVIYTAHGFHFFKGAPLRNWLLYYPVEKFLSRWTDCLITINREDYQRAKKKFHAKRTEYVPGVGIDLEKIRATKVNRSEKRKEIGIPDDAYLLLSVGELSVRKNHILVLRALCGLEDGNVYYAICGQGQSEEELQDFVKRHGLEKRVKLLGYRSDVIEICKAADLFVFPSLQEGLPVALMEAMASGLPCVASDIRGNRDLVGKDGKENLLPPREPERWAESIQKYMECYERDGIAKKNRKKMEQFSEDKIFKRMKEIYGIVVDDK